MKPLDILIVDDNRDSAESLAMLLDGRGYRVETVYSGESSLECVRRNNFDLIVMDVKLPGMNGTESFLEIRKLRPEARVIMITGYSVEELLNQAVENGAWGVLHKPIDIQTLFKHLDAIKPTGILVVDDDREFLRSLKELLFSNGYRIYVAEDGHTALQKAGSEDFDILILDLKLPLLNGIQVFQQLRERGCIYPTIIVTAYEKRYDQQLKALNSQYLMGVLAKPFDPEILLDMINRLADDGEGENVNGKR